MSLYLEYEIKKRLSIVLYGFSRFRKNHVSWLQCFIRRKLFDEAINDVINIFSSAAVKMFLTF